MLEFVLGRENIRIPDNIYSFEEGHLNYWTLKDDHSSVVNTVKLDNAYKSPHSRGSSKSNDDEWKQYGNFGYSAFAANHCATGLSCDPDVKDKPSTTRLVTHTPAPASTPITAPIPPVRLSRDPNVITTSDVPA